MDARDERDGMGWVMGTRWLLETEAQRINPILSILCIHASSPVPPQTLLLTIASAPSAAPDCPILGCWGRFCRNYGNMTDIHDNWTLYYV